VPSIAPAGTPGRRRNVLIVDDEATLGRTIQRSLAPHHDAVVFTHARAALAAIEGGERYDVILTDVMMPEMTGMEMYERLLEIDPDQARRVVFLTGGAFTPAAREFLDAVPNAILEKPFDPKSLREIIAEFTPVAATPRAAHQTPRDGP